MSLTVPEFTETGELHQHYLYLMSLDKTKLPESALTPNQRGSDTRIAWCARITGDHYTNRLQISIQARNIPTVYDPSVLLLEAAIRVLHR